MIGAIYSSEDGRVNPSDLCLALSKGARAKGALLVEDTPVTGFEVEQGRVRAVLTERGRVACDAVVLCAGLWSRQIGALAGVNVPLYACEHFYLLTKPIEGITGHLPTLSDHDGHLYIRDDVGGLLVGCFEPQGKALPMERLPKDFAFDLLNEDWDHFEPMMLNGLHRIPALETAAVRTLLNGPESFTPDGSFLMGEAPEVEGFFVGCGMNSVGVATGGGMGRALAQWILQGHPEADLWPTDIRRVHPVYGTEAALKERAPEALGLHYAISYPGREHKTARNLKLSPLHDRLATAGAVFGERSGWERPSYFGAPYRDEDLTFDRPVWFEAVGSEHRAARETVALFDQSTFTKIGFSGPDALTYLQRLCANDIDVPPGRIVYSALLNPRGTFESDLTLLRLAEDRFLLVTGTGHMLRDPHWLRRNAQEAQVVIEEVTDRHAVLGLTGPRARDLLIRLTSNDLCNAAFPYYTWQRLEIAGQPVLAARLSYAGELGWELYVESQTAPALFDALHDAGQDLGLRLAGTSALTSLRVEKGYRAFGHELTGDDTPLQAGLGFAVKFDKPGGFIGREALLAQREAGVGRRLLFLLPRDPEANPIGGEPILRGGKAVGQVTSCAFGHSVGRMVTMGYVTLLPEGLDATLASDHYCLDIAGELTPCDISLKAPYDPSGSAMKQ